MKRIIGIIVFLLVSVTWTADLYSQSNFGKKKVGRDRLSEDNSSGRTSEQKGPPGPGGGGEGDPIPINGGIFLLLGLSALYLFKEKDEK